MVFRVPEKLECVIGPLAFEGRERFVRIEGGHRVYGLGACIGATLLWRVFGGHLRDAIRHRLQTLRNAPGRVGVPVTKSFQIWRRYPSDWRRQNRTSLKKRSIIQQFQAQALSLAIPSEVHFPLPSMR